MCQDSTLKVHVYWHNVPLINGFPERDQDCKACQLFNQPQSNFFEVHMCERELGSFRSGKEPTCEEVHYMLLMSQEVIMVHCYRCFQILSRAEFLEHKCQNEEE